VVTRALAPAWLCPGWGGQGRPGWHEGTQGEARGWQRGTGKRLTVAVALRSRVPKQRTEGDTSKRSPPEEGPQALSKGGAARDPPARRSDWFCDHCPGAVLGTGKSTRQRRVVARRAGGSGVRPGVLAQGRSAEPPGSVPPLGGRRERI